MKSKFESHDLSPTYSLDRRLRPLEGYSRFLRLESFQPRIFDLQKLNTPCLLPLLITRYSIWITNLPSLELQTHIRDQYLHISPSMPLIDLRFAPFASLCPSPSPGNERNLCWDSRIFHLLWWMESVLTTQVYCTCVIIGDHSIKFVYKFLSTIIHG